ncbi:MAG: DUF4160 domain-containing protein [Candidatus Kapabacteria bacterium]|nr:DUF4160 domain-containing protein [Candidatus Kapabacteria bacterium]
MPAISMFYGLVIYIYNIDIKRHKLPHLHVKYQDHSAVIGIPEGEVLDGSLPNKKLNMVRAWISIHEEDLMANWDLAVQGQTPFKIDPLK